MKIEKLNNNSYRLRKMVKGKTYTAVVDYKPDQKEAQLIMAEVMKNEVVQKGKNTFHDIFKLACQEREKLKSYRTIKKYEMDYKRFIDDNLSNTKISDITINYLKKYTAEMVNRLKPPKKAFLGYKTLLNLIFDYAADHNYIPFNIAHKLNNKEYLPKCDNTYKSAEDKAMDPKQVKDIIAEVDRRLDMKKYGPFYATGLMFKLSALTGMRVGELCALRWDDIYDNYIHIHAQQLLDQKTYKPIYATWTKNEKGVSKGGRKFPLTNDIKVLLADIKKRQGQAKKDSEWVFVGTNGKWITTNTYVRFLTRISQNLGYEITNNHAVRMYFNSYVMIPAGITVANRAKLLGHSVEVNLKNYTFEDHDYCDNALNALNNKII